MGSQPLLTLRPVLCKAGSSKRLLLLPPPLAVGVDREEEEAARTKVVAAAAEASNPGAAPSAGDQRELVGNVCQIYSEHSYCRLPT